MKKLFCMVCACLLALSAQATDIKKYDALYENLPFQMEKVTRPQFPANEVNLKDFGAIGDGSSLCTTAFAKAIDALTQKGGGKLIVPQGVWFTGPIVLKSNINLHLEKGAVILFSPDDALYPSLIHHSRVWIHAAASRQSLAIILPTLQLPVRVASTETENTGDL